MVLLLWTAADLTNSSLCALDAEDTHPAASADTATASLQSDREAPAPLPVHSDAPHVDDCFCCSHCVEVSSLTVATTSMPAAPNAVFVLLAAPRLVDARLYRPPLA